MAANLDSQRAAAAKIEAALTELIPTAKEHDLAILGFLLERALLEARHQAGNE